MRQRVVQIFHAGLAGVNGGKRVAAYLKAHPLEGEVHAVAIGKAAPAMMEGAFGCLGERIARALVITKEGCGRPLPRTLCLEAGHPLPDRRSLEAGQKLLAFLEAAPSRARLLFLISGGASALVECLPRGMDLERLQSVQRWLLASGMDIHRINAVRKRLSLIKGGKLIPYLKGRPTLNLLISDVPGDAPATIGSGLLVPSREPLPELPPGLGRLPLIPPPEEEAPFVHTEILATYRDAQAAAAKAARLKGYRVRLHPSLVTGEAEAEGRRLARDLLEDPSHVHIWSGETTVRLPSHPGMGGRCQHLALAASLVMEGYPCVLLAAGTDGTDGPTPFAGAVVDGGTVKRGRERGLDPRACLRAADAGRFLAATGDILVTGPTGTNVMDMMIGMGR
ncbi:MAG: DUF4147 domain-containing protein [Gammaproteobacteria bacterium]|nr:MAG: DUF4147 domain-containing protein [Gammaproteobacteria bacterium]